jgi:hypothetical protein
MAIDPATKALLESQHNQLSEAISNIARDLRRSNEACEKLTLECTDLRKQLSESRAEVEVLRLAMDVNADAISTVKSESAAAIRAAVVKSDARIDGVRIELDDLEQYGRRKSIRVQNVTVVAGEGKDDTDNELLLASINATLAPSKIVLKQEDVIRFHRSSAAKDDKYTPDKKVSQCIIKLRNWRLRQQFQGLNSLMRAQEKNGGEGCRVYHDLTRRRLALLNNARDDCVSLPGWFAYADMNSNLKLRNGDRFLKFNTEEELEAAINKIKQ